MHYTLEEIINSHIYDAMCIKCYYTIHLFTMYLKFVVYFQITNYIFWQPKTHSKHTRITT